MKLPGRDLWLEMSSAVLEILEFVQFCEVTHLLIQPWEWMLGNRGGKEVRGKTKTIVCGYSQVCLRVQERWPKFTGNYSARTE